MGLKILVIDDSSVTRAMVIKTLKMAGLEIDEIVQAGNGQEGLQALKDNWVDVVFTDLNMPVMDGEEMIDNLRGDPSYADMPLVVISTEGSETRVNRLKDKGAKFIHKPFSPEVVREVVEDISAASESQAGKYDETLQAVAEETAMSLAFLFTAMDEQDVATHEGPTILGHVEFEGPVRGALFLRAPTGMLPELAANMLGMDEDRQEVPTWDQQLDALRELINVICGNLLPQIAGTEAVVRVSPPELEDSAEIPQTFRNRPLAGSAKLMLEAGLCELGLFLEGKIVAAADLQALNP